MMENDTNSFKVNPAEVKQIAQDVRQGIVGILEKENLAAQMQDQLTSLAQLQSNAQSSPILKFGCALACLHLHAKLGTLPDAQVASLLDFTAMTVKIIYTGDRRSQGALLFSMLRETESALAAGRGDHQTALWKQQLAAQMRTGADDMGADTRMFVLGQRYMRTANASEAIACFRACELNAESSYRFRALAALTRMDTLRLAGDKSAAKEISAALGRQDELLNDELLRRRLHWTNIIKGCQGGNHARMLSEVFARNSSAGAEEALLAFLTVHATKMREWIKRVPKIRSIRARYQEEFQAAPQLRHLARLCQTLETFYDSVVPLEKRCEDLSESLVQAQSLGTLEHELLFRAASMRAFTRFGQTALRAVALRDYKSLSLKASSGLSDDVLGHSKDIDASKSDSVEMVSVPAPLIESQSGRAFAMIKASSAVTATLLSTKARTLLASHEEKERLQNLAVDSLSEQLLHVFGNLSGIATKVGQMLSYCNDTVPEPLRLTLGLLQDQAPTSRTFDTRELVERELAVPIDSIFKNWTDEPIASASIGQVHRAQLLDGTEVAIKIQYPGVAQAMVSDLKNVKIFKALFAPFFPKAKLDEILSECMDLLQAECDYQAEAQHQQTFRENFSGHPNIYIPKVYPHLSTGRVLTTEYVEMRSFQEFAYEATQKERNMLGRLLFEFMYTSILRDGIVYGDPQPGNFFVKGDGGLCVIDFGCVKLWTEATSYLYRDYLRAAMVGDRESVGQTLDRLGMIMDAKQFDMDAELQNIGDYYMRPFLYGDNFKFDPAHVKKSATASLTENPNKGQGTVPKDLVVLARITWGLNYMLGQLEAEACWRDILVPLLFHETDRPEPLARDFYKLAN